jgi:hypothetical protein
MPLIISTFPQPQFVATDSGASANAHQAREHSPADLQNTPPAPHAHMILPREPSSLQKRFDPVRGDNSSAPRGGENHARASGRMAANPPPPVLPVRRKAISIGELLNPKQEGPGPGPSDFRQPAEPGPALKRRRKGAVGGSQHALPPAVGAAGIWRPNTSANHGPFLPGQAFFDPAGVPFTTENTQGEDADQAKALAFLWRSKQAAAAYTLPDDVRNFVVKWARGLVAARTQGQLEAGQPLSDVDKLAALSKVLRKLTDLKNAGIEVSLRAIADMNESKWRALAKKNSATQARLVQFRKAVIDSLGDAANNTPAAFQE